MSANADPAAQAISDVQALESEITSLQDQLKAAEAAKAQLAPPTPPPTEDPVPPPPVATPAAPAAEYPAPDPAPPAVDPEQAANTPGGAAAVAAQAAPAAEEPAPPAAPAAASATPILDALKSTGIGDFVTNVRKVSQKLLDEGQILEGDLLTPGESHAVNSTVIKLIGELIGKVGL